MPDLDPAGVGVGVGDGGAAVGRQGRWQAGVGDPSIQKHPSTQKKGPGSSIQEGSGEPRVRKIDACRRQRRAGGWPPGWLLPQVIRLMGRRRRQAE